MNREFILINIIGIDKPGVTSAPLKHKDATPSRSRLCVICSPAPSAYAIKRWEFRNFENKNRGGFLYFRN